MRSFHEFTLAGLCWCLGSACSLGLDQDAPFQERAQRVLDNAEDAWFMAREQAMERQMSDEELDKMSMSITEALAFEAAQRDPSAPRFVRSAALQARRRELETKLEQMRARRGQGLPDEPERSEHAK